jgi:hypothetical protein
MSTSIALNLVFYSLGLRFFTLDDAYIVLKSSENFIEYGELFSYNVMDENTNAITSFLFYLISIIIVAPILMVGAPLVESYTFVVFTFNFFCLLNTARDFYQIMLNTFTRTTSRFILVFFATLYPILVIWTNGLETSLGLFLVVRIARKLLEGEYRGLHLNVILLILTRPDLGLSVLIVLFTLTFTKSLSNLKYLIEGVSVFLIPIIITKIVTGEFLTSSISRVPIGGNEDIYYKLISAVKNLLRAPVYFANFSVPHDGFNALSNFIPSSIKFFSMGLFLYFLSLTAGRVLFLYRTASDFPRYLENIHFGKMIIFLYLMSLITVSSLTGTGLGEFNRYFVFIYVIALILILISEPKLIHLGAIKSLLLVNLLMMPAAFVEVGSSITLNNQVLYPVAKKVQKIANERDIVMLDSAGLISILGKGKIIDVYGLGTQRYSKIHGDFKQVYRLINKDRPDFIVAWKMDKPTYYLDSAHYELALVNAKLIPVFSRRDSYFGKNSYPELTIYRVNYS